MTERATGAWRTTRRDGRRVGTCAVSSIAILGVLLVGASPAPAAVPGANGTIAFASTRDGNYEVYVMNADGSGQTNLTNDPAADLDPVWSPEGTRIAFTHDGEVFVMNADGSGRTNLTNHPAYDFDPTWSPDGTRIAFASDRDGFYDIYVMDADGSGQTNLTNLPGFYDFRPAWSPDGTKIAFQTNRERNVEVYVMNADGSAPTNLTRNPKATDFDPAWSPDGSRIAFASGTDSTRAEVFVVNADGSGLTNLTNNGAASDFGPAWSPDGTRIAFASQRDDNHDVYVVNADGSGTVDRLTTDPAIDLAPDWQTIPSADLALSLAASPSIVKAKRPLTYTITVTNQGPSTASGVVVTNVLPSQTSFVSVSPSTGSCEAPPPNSTGTIVCHVGTLANGDEVTISITVKALVRRSTLTDTATVTSEIPDPDATNNSASVTTPVR
jgi:uncharacterized repeat protein (TIGR01451 family)